MKMKWKEMFPQLINETNVPSNVDISTNDIMLPSFKAAVESSIHDALSAWDKIDPIYDDTILNYRERMEKYQELTQQILLNTSFERNDNESLNETLSIDVIDEHLSKAKRRKRMKTEETKAIFNSMPNIDDFQAQRHPSLRLQEFIAKYPVGKIKQVQKRSAADITTSACFEFARPPSHTEKFIKKLADPSEEPYLIWIDVLHPSKQLSKTQSFLVWSFQTIGELVNAIVCANDERLRLAMENSSIQTTDSFVANNKKNHVLYWNGTFYLSNVYNGELQFGAMEYAQNIHQWILSSPDRMKFYYGDRESNDTNLQCKFIDETKFKDLLIAPNAAGVFIHLGECEHVLVVRDAKLPNPYDSREVHHFPLRLPCPSYRSFRKCGICRNFNAKIVSYHDSLSITEPMLFCHKCFEAAHGRKDINGNKSCNVYPFIQD